MSGILSFKIARAELQVLPKAQNMEIKTIVWNYLYGKIRKKGVDCSNDYCKIIMFPMNTPIQNPHIEQLRTNISAS